MEYRIRNCVKGDRTLLLIGRDELTFKNKWQSPHNWNEYSTGYVEAYGIYCWGFFSSLLTREVALPVLEGSMPMLIVVSCTEWHLVVQVFFFVLFAY